MAAIVMGILISPAMADDFPSTSKAPEPPDKGKLSYAVGSRMGTQLIHASTNVDFQIAAQAVLDVLEGNPTMIQEAEIGPLLNEGRSSVIAEQPMIKNREKISYAGGMRIGLHLKRTGMELDPKVVGQGISDVLAGKGKMEEADTVALFMQAEAYTLAKKTSGNKSAGAAFLAKNAKEPGVKVLPDGLQYKVLRPGSDEMPGTNDLIFVKFRGTFVDGTEFDRHDHFLTQTQGGIQGWQDALSRMRVGEKWRIFVPPALAFGEEGQSIHGVGPDATLIYDLELVSIAPPGNYQVSSGVGHGLDVGATTPAPESAK